MTDEQPDYSFARRPKWIVSHVLVLGLIASMIVAGLWQIDRYQSRSERNELIAERAVQAPVALSSIAPPGVGSQVGEEQQFRRVVVTGEFRVEDEVLIRNRTFDGAPGWWVLTPLVTDQGWAVAVNRGWIPLWFDADAARPGTEPPTGRVEVAGFIQPSRKAEGFQVADPEAGTLDSLGRPDVERLAAQLDYELSPVVLRIDPASVPELSQPRPLSLPPLDGGPHLSYAVQWFVFTAIALGGYPIVLRRVAQGRAASQPD